MTNFNLPRIDHTPSDRLLWHISILCCITYEIIWILCNDVVILRPKGKSVVFTLNLGNDQLLMIKPEGLEGNLTTDNLTIIIS